MWSSRTAGGVSPGHVRPSPGPTAATLLLDGVRSARQRVSCRTGNDRLPAPRGGTDLRAGLSGGNDTLRGERRVTDHLYGGAGRRRTLFERRMLRRPAPADHRSRLPRTCGDPAERRPVRGRTGRGHPVRRGSTGRGGQMFARQRVRHLGGVPLCGAVRHVQEVQPAHGRVAASNSSSRFRRATVGPTATAASRWAARFTPVWRAGFESRLQPNLLNSDRLKPGLKTSPATPSRSAVKKALTAPGRRCPGGELARQDVQRLVASRSGTAPTAVAEGHRLRPPAVPASGAGRSAAGVIVAGPRSHPRVVPTSRSPGCECRTVVCPVGAVEGPHVAHAVGCRRVPGRVGGVVSLQAGNR